MKSFNIEEAKNGAKVCTQNGHPVRIICFDANLRDTPIIALVDLGSSEDLQPYRTDGKIFPNDEDCEHNLMMADDED